MAWLVSKPTSIDSRYCCFAGLGSLSQHDQALRQAASGTMIAMAAQLKMRAWLVIGVVVCDVLHCMSIVTMCCIAECG